MIWEQKERRSMRCAAENGGSTAWAECPVSRVDGTSVSMYQVPKESTDMYMFLQCSTYTYIDLYTPMGMYVHKIHPAQMLS